MNNITKIQFNPDQDYIWGIQGLEQWDQGQKLEISGLDISDEIVEVHFSLDEVQGNAKRMLGVVKGGVIHADIPVFILEGPEHIFCNADTYSAYAWIYVSDDESAETIRKMEFTIKARPKPDEYVTPEELTFLQQLELAIQNKLDKSGHAPNKFLGTDEKGNVVTKEQEEFSLKVANEEKLGGVKPLNKTDDMTLEVGVDKDGRLFAKGKDIKVDSELSEESTNPVQNKVLTKEVNTLKEHNTQLKETIEKLQIKVTTEKASFHHITDSANMKVLDFGMEGKTEQETTEGKNLCDLQIGKCFNIYNGEIEEAVHYAMCSIEASEEMSVTISIPSGEEHGWYLSYMYHKDTCTNLYHKIHPGQSTTFTLPEGVTMLSGDAFMNETSLGEFKPIKVQIEAGSVATTYEPYTGGQPSPNPDYPQEIKNAGVYNEATGRYEHKFGFVNENLLPNNPEKWDIGKMLYWGASKGTEVGWATRVYSAYTEIEIQPNTNICFHNDMTNKYWVSRIVETDSNRFGYSNHDLYTSIAKNYADYSFKTLSNTVKLLVEVRLVDDTQTFTEADLQEMKIAFGYGDSVIYTPRQSQHFTLTSPVPLTKWDKLVKRDGVYGWSIWSECLNLNGDSGWVATNGNKGFYCECLPTNYSTRDAYCSQLINDPMRDNTVNGLWVGSGNKCVYARTSAFFDNTLSDFGLANWKTHLNENSLVVWYQTLEEQSFHPLPDEEQTLLNNLETYYGVTNLYNDQGCPTWLTYVTDPKLYLDNQLLEIKSAIV